MRSTQERRAEVKVALQLHRLACVDGVISAYCERSFLGIQRGSVSLPNNEQFETYGPHELRSPHGRVLVQSLQTNPRAARYVDVAKCQLVPELPLNPPIIALFPNTALVWIEPCVCQYDLKEQMVLGELPGSKSSSVVVLSSNHVAYLQHDTPMQPFLLVWNLATRAATAVQGLSHGIMEVLANDDKSFFVCERQRVVQLDTNSGQTMGSFMWDEHHSTFIAEGALVGLDRVAALVGNEDTWKIRIFEFGERRRSHTSLASASVVVLPWRFYPDECCLHVIDSQYVVVQMIEVDDQVVALVDINAAVIVHWFHVDRNSAIEFIAWNHTLLLVGRDETLSESATVVQGFDVLTKLKTHDFPVIGEWAGVVHGEFYLTLCDDKCTLLIGH